MSEKTTRYGKYLGKNSARTPHHLYPKDWGTKRQFKGSELNVYLFRDPKTGFEYHIHAPSQEIAQRQADIRGWVQYRKNNRTGKGKKSKRK